MTRRSSAISWRPALTVFRKECKDHLRDKRSIILSFVFPLLAPLVLGLLLSTLGTRGQGSVDRSGINVPVSGAEYAPAFIDYLTEHGFVIVDAPEGLDAQKRFVRRGRAGLVLVIPPEAEGTRKYSLQIVFDRSQPRSMIFANEVLRRVNDFSDLTALDIVQEQGLDAGDIQPVTVKEVNIARPTNTADFFYRMIPSLVVFMVFMGAVYLAIDTTVGERERGSLEPLLTAPVDRGVMLFGKCMATLLFTAMIVTINLTAFYFVLNWATEGAAHLTQPPSIFRFLGIFITAVPLMMLAVTIQMNIAMLTRSAKEAQIYLGLLPVIPLIPGLLMVFAPAVPTISSSMVPIYAQLVMFLAIVNGESIGWAPILIGAASCLACAGVMFALASQLFERERMVFGN